MKPIALSVFFSLFVLLAACSNGDTYKATTSVFIRSNAAKTSTVIGSLKKGETIDIVGEKKGWVEVKYNGQTGYVYKKFLEPVNSGMTSMFTESVDNVTESVSEGIGSITESVGNSTSNKTSAPKKTVTPVKSGKSFTDNLSSVLGIGMGVFILLVVFVIWGLLGIPFLSSIIYYVFSLPFYLLNKLQFILYAPERYLCKNYDSIVSKIARSKIGTILFFLEHVALYVVCTPLRFVNAFYFNILVHLPCAYLDLVLETIHPSGHANVGVKVMRVIPNFFKLVVLKGFATTVESILFVAVDTVYPALTLYHGTAWKAGISITKPGSWMSSEKDMRCWYGKGVYFAQARSTAEYYGRSKPDMVMIVSRVSHGRMLNLSLLSKRMYNNIGKDSNKTGRITNNSLNKGYPSVYVWAAADGSQHKWWEIVMLDRGGEYDYKWRIRPLYIVGIKDKARRRIFGGMSLWTI